MAFFMFLLHLSVILLLPTSEPANLHESTLLLPYELQPLFLICSLLLQTCLNSPDPPAIPASNDQRMSATGYEETELTYNVNEGSRHDHQTDQP